MAKLKEMKTAVKGEAKHTSIATYALAFGLILILASAGYFLYANSGSSGARPVRGAVGSTHEHTGFAVYVEGKQIDFSQNKYQLQADFVHVENGDGTTIHKHATGVTFSDFLLTERMKLSKDCFKMDGGKEYCSSGDKTLKFYVNRQKSDLLENYELRDGDRILLSYGPETEAEIQEQLDSIRFNPEG